ncbi:pyridoxal phosphate-dependent transferase [Dendryphion nanum]|uniref:Pyridoxal phosphate-dependent transferase n=1 Tax=Dendryphion nanum TaxID=256645 RepID=A0A9P9DAZ7_9PLEO|nr:pyridoxal phosphate-dependent transferase [Dendryphion nanum]
MSPTHKPLPLLPLEHTLSTHLSRRTSTSTLRTLTTTTPTQTDFSSNDFLSLSLSPLLRTAFITELTSTTLPLGSGGSRLLDGNSTYAEALESAIAAFHGAEAGLLFNSGFDANAGFFACVPQPGDFVVYDELIHASVHDGMRLSRCAGRFSFRHNCVQDLEKVLRGCLERSDALRKGESHVIVAVEAVYSMDGDLAPLQSILDVVEGVLSDGCGYVVVDEAHSTGVIGPKGRGLVCELGVEKRVFARLHTFGKAVACNGAIILGSPILRHYLINYARPLIYTTFLSYPALAAIKASYTLLQTGQTVHLAQHLQSMIQTLFNKLNAVTCPAFKTLLKVPTTCPQSPIFSLQTPEPKLLAKFLQERDMMVRAVVSPTVPEGTERVRVCLHAGNTEEDVEKLVSSLEVWARLRQGKIEGSREGKMVMIARL